MRYIDKTINTPLYIFDNSKSILTNREINLYKSEITKIKHRSVLVCYDTFEILHKGLTPIADKSFCLIEKQLEI